MQAVAMRDLLYSSRDGNLARRHLRMALRILRSLFHPPNLEQLCEIEFAATAFRTLESHGPPTKAGSWRRFDFGSKTARNR
jgi:hypothetical protein